MLGFNPISSAPISSLLAATGKSSAQSGIQRLINQITAATGLNQQNAWIKNPLETKKEKAYEEEFLMQFMFEYYHNH